MRKRHLYMDYMDEKAVCGWKHRYSIYDFATFHAVHLALYRPDYFIEGEMTNHAIQMGLSKLICKKCMKLAKPKLVAMLV